MSRNASGTYSQPAAAPNDFNSGDVISSAKVNAKINDLGNEITASLSRDGYGGMRSALKGIPGDAAGPAFAFTSEPGTGVFLAGASDLGVAVGGNKKVDVTATGVAVTGTLGATGNATVGGTLAVTGATTVTGNTAVGGTLAVTGTTTLSGGLVGQIAVANLPAVNRQTSSAFSYGSAASGYVTVAASAVSITTSGRPVLVMLQPNSGSAGGIITVANSVVGFNLQRDGTTIAQWSLGPNGAGVAQYISTSAIQALDAPAAGAHTYTIQVNNGSTTAGVTGSCVLVACEF